MADEDDDLDAFFDEVSEVEAKAVEEEEPKKQNSVDAKIDEDDNDDDAQEPPAKRVKTSNPAPMRPRGVVVASSTSVVIPAKEREEQEKKAELEAASQNLQQHHSSTSPSAPTLGGRFVPAVPTVGPNATNAATTGTNSSTIGPAFPGNPQNSNIQQQQQQQQTGKKKKAAVRMAAGHKWVDESLDEWPENDFRIFVGNLSNDVTDATLFQHFQKYPSLAKAKVVRHNNNPEKSKGYGFVSFLEAREMARALREMDQTWLASRPIRIKRSDWKERDFKVVKKRQKKEQKQRRF